MRIAFLASVAFFLGSCGSSGSSAVTADVQDSGSADAGYFKPGAPIQAAVEYPIDSGAGALVAPAAVIITTNGQDWVLAFPASATPVQFEGAVAVVSPAVIGSATIEPGGAGSVVHTDSATQLRFEVTASATVQTLKIAVDPPSHLRLHLKRDGADLGQGQVVFTSGGQPSTISAMPFGLVPSNLTP